MRLVQKPFQTSGDASAAGAHGSFDHARRSSVMISLLSTSLSSRDDPLIKLVPWSLPARIRASRSMIVSASLRRRPSMMSDDFLRIYCLSLWSSWLILSLTDW